MARPAIISGGEEGERIPLPGVPGSKEFLDAYQAALEHRGPKMGLSNRGGHGSFDHLVREYFASPDYLRLAPQTQINYRRIIERFLDEEKVGHRLVKEMTRQHVQKIIARQAQPREQRTTCSRS